MLALPRCSSMTLRRGYANVRPCSSRSRPRSGSPTRRTAMSYWCGIGYEDGDRPPFIRQVDCRDGWCQVDAMESEAWAPTMVARHRGDHRRPIGPCLKAPRATGGTSFGLRASSSGASIAHCVSVKSERSVTAPIRHEAPAGPGPIATTTLPTCILLRLCVDTQHTDDLPHWIVDRDQVSRTVASMPVMNAMTSIRKFRGFRFSTLNDSTASLTIER